MHRSTRIATFALAGLVVVPALALASLAQKSKPLVSGKLKSQLAAVGKTAKKLPAAKKESLSMATESASVKLPSMTAPGMFSSASATDQEALLGYFAGEKLAIVKVGLPFLKDEYLGKQLRIVGSLFPDTKAEQIANDTATKIEAGKYDENEVNKNLDLLVGGIGMAYEKKGEAANFNFRAGSTMGLATVLGVLYGSDDFNMRKQVKSAFEGVQSNARDIAKSASGDLAEGPKKAFAGFGDATITGQESALAAIEPVDDAYLTALKGQ